MMTFNQSNTAFLLILSLFLSSSNCRAQETDSKALHIYQTSGIIGDQDVFITANGIKIINRSSGLTTISKAPDWKVLTFHTKSKLYCNQPLKSFRGYIPTKEFVSTGKRWSEIPFEKSKTKTVAGINATVYTTPNSFTAKQLKDWQREFADSKFIKSARYCVATNLKTDPKVRQILCRFYGLANKGGLPIEFKYHDLGGYLHVGLITSSKKEIEEPDKFQLPQGYKEVKSIDTLLKLVRGRKNNHKKRRPLL